MKITGIVILILSSCLAGCLASAELKRRAENMRRIRLMIEKLRLMIRYEALEVSEIARRLAEDESLGGLDFLTELTDSVSGFYGDGCGETFRACWRKAADNAGFPPDERDLLFNIGDILGSCDCEGQLSALSLCAAEADRLAALSLENSAAKGRLYRSLGAVAGALIAIMIV
ncbi:MAG: stage III sporulation protein AB [Ruminococcus sp.]|nr:stage III sporulation protein AB [Ruminococcus sp.]